VGKTERVALVDLVNFRSLTLARRSSVRPLRLFSLYCTLNSSQEPYSTQWPGAPDCAGSPPLLRRTRFLALCIHIPSPHSRPRSHIRRSTPPLHLFSLYCTPDSSQEPCSTRWSGTSTVPHPHSAYFLVPELFTNTTPEEVGKRKLFVVLSSDKGLCGGIHSSISKATRAAIKEADPKSPTRRQV